MRRCGRPAYQRQPVAGILHGEVARSDDGAAVVQSKNTRKSLRCNSSALQTVSGRSSSDEPINRVYFGRTRNPAAKKNLLGALSRMGKLRQCVTGRARARACELQDSSAPMPMSISGGAAGNCRAAEVRREVMYSAVAVRCGGLQRADSRSSSRREGFAVSAIPCVLLLPLLHCCTRRV